MANAAADTANTAAPNDATPNRSAAPFVAGVLDPVASITLLVPLGKEVGWDGIVTFVDWLCAETDESESKRDRMRDEV